MKISPKITIIVPVYNAEKHLTRLLDSLTNLDYKNYKIILVIDKNSKDSSEEIAKNFERRHKDIVKVIKNTKRGSAANRNLGTSKADRDTEYYAFTDSDCYVDRDWLNVLVDTIENSPKEVICVGGINLTPPTDNKIAKLTGYIEQTILGGGNTAQTKIFSKKTYVKSIPNCNALYRKEIWDFNKQDESLITGQDGEFNLRLYNKGLKFLINPHAKVWHHRPSTLKKYFKRMYNYGKASAKILKKQKNKLAFLKNRWYGFIPLLYYLLLTISIILTLTKIINSLVPLILLTPYLLGIIFTTLQVTTKSKTIYSSIVPFIVIMQHMAYSWGLFRELIKFHHIPKKKQDPYPKD